MNPNKDYIRFNTKSQWLLSGNNSRRGPTMKPTRLHAICDVTEGTACCCVATGLQLAIFSSLRIPLSPKVLIFSLFVRCRSKWLLSIRHHISVPRRIPTIFLKEN